jgi:hypothetical protein
MPTNQLLNNRGEPRVVALGPARLDQHVLTVNKTCFLQTLDERGEITRRWS